MISARRSPPLFVMVALVLPDCVQYVANLLLAQGAARQRELAIRAAMGASRGRMTGNYWRRACSARWPEARWALLIGAWLMNLLTPSWPLIFRSRD